MPDRSTQTGEFQKASSSLTNLLEKLQREFTVWKASSTEFFQGFQETLHRYRTAVHEMPKAFRHHPLVKKSLEEIDSLENEFRRFRMKLKDESLHDFQEWWDHLRARGQQATLFLSELETSPLVQKILRGEPLLANKKVIQWRRKLTHVTMGLSFLYLFVYSGWPKSVVWGITAPFIIWSFGLETLRHLNPAVNRWVLRLFGSIMREGENEKINAAIFYIFSIGVVYFIFPIQVTVLTLLFIAVGDPVAGIVGTLWGRHRISSHVSWEGAIACFLVCGALAALAAGRLFSDPIGGGSLVLFSVLSGIVGAAAEASFKRLDDNLVMPLLSAPALWLLMKLFSVLA